MLHIVKDSPNHMNSLNRCIDYAQHNDIVLLVNDAVIACLNWQFWQLQLHSKSLQCYCLQEDIEARGLTAHATNVPQVNYDGWVQLSEQQRPNITW